MLSRSKYNPVLIYIFFVITLYVKNTGMTKLLFTLLLFAFSVQVFFAQTVKILEYATIQQAHSAEEAGRYKQNLLKTLGSSGADLEFIEALFAKEHTHTLFFHRDSSLSLHYFDGKRSNNLGFKFGKSAGTIDLSNGKIFYADPKLMQRTIDRTVGKGKISLNDVSTKDELIKRLSRKEMIDGYECEVWEVQHPRSQSETKYWVWKGNHNINLDQNSLLTFQGKLVVKSVSQTTQAWDQTVTRSLLRIDSIQNYSIQRKLDELFAQYAGEMVRYYADLPNNHFDDSLDIQVGSVLPALNFRTIETDQVTNLDSLLKGSKFLLIDMWVSWCGPCIKSFPELEKLKGDYGTSLQILSLNYGDQSFSKIQSVLDKQEPSWPQAYSSHRIYRLVNKEHAYPTMLVIDQNRKIVLQGQPDLSITAIRNFLDENLK